MQQNQPLICLITGATSGLGLATAIALARQGLQIIAVGQSTDSTDRAVATIREQSGSGLVDGLHADLSLQSDIRALAMQVQQRYNRLDILINNAGLTLPDRRESKEGIEMNWAVNCVAPFLLSTLLTPLLKASAPARIINITSAAQGFGRFHFDDIQFEHTPYRGMAAYAQSKLALTTLTIEMAAKLQGSGISVNCVHPGGMRSRLNRELGLMSRIVMLVTWPLWHSPEVAAKQIVHLAVSPTVAQASGVYFVKGKARTPNKQALDTGVRERLWQLLKHQTSA